ncbi:MAG TPA: sensor domain-containing diguanylate cyclase [bacterium]|nr:sensor domain-containing diguanylate cyclase [bacterium]
MVLSGRDSAVAGLARIATELSSLTVKLPEFLIRAVALWHQELGIEHCLIALVEERGAGRLVVRAAAGRAPEAGAVLSADVFARVIESGEAVAIADLGTHLGRGGPGLRSCVSAPILVQGRAVGVVNAYHPDPARFTREDLDLIINLARSLSGGLEHAGIHRKPAEVPGADPLTDLPNEASFRESLERELRLAERHNEPLALLGLNIDGLPRISDRYGPATCDTLLRKVAKILQGMLRESDVVARGSVGFLILLPRTPKRAGSGVAERIRRRVTGVLVDGGPSLTVSVGLSSSDGRTAADTLLGGVIEALEEAQSSGGDRVTVVVEDA